MVERCLVAGIDEVGRGPLAGPLVAAAVILNPHRSLRGLKDSKLLSTARREQLALKIRQRGMAIGIGWQSASAIDRLGLTEATRRAMTEAVQNLKIKYDQMIVDGNYNYLSALGNCRAIIKADRSISCVMAASIIAKVSRDTYMKRMATVYHQYGFDSHVGYATAQHRQRLEACGPSPLHRLSYKPLMSTAIGKWAESVAADYLQNHGFQILDQNWKNRWCEIDIVAQKDHRIHLVEVKFRQTAAFGSGLDYITARKAKQMQFAALQWVGEHGWTGDYQLDVVAIDGQVQPQITFIESI